MELVELPWTAARLWQALAFGTISGLLLWTCGLARAHGGLAAAAVLAGIFVAAGWNPALLCAFALTAAGVASRFAAASAQPARLPSRLGLAGVAALGAVPVASAWIAQSSGRGAWAAAGFAGALAGGVAVWWHRSQADSGRAGLAAAAALAAACLLGAGAWALGLLGPGDGVLPAAGAAIALAATRRIRSGGRSEAFLGSLVAAGLSAALAALLP